MTRNDFIKRVAEKGKEVYGKRFYYTDIEKILRSNSGNTGRCNGRRGTSYITYVWYV